VSAFCAVTDDIAAEARLLKPICASIAQNGGASFLALAGIDVDVPAHIEGIYPDLVHAEDWDAAVEICSAWISDEARSASPRSSASSAPRPGSRNACAPCTPTESPASCSSTSAPTPRPPN
jgi:hypothetical protein